MVVSKFKNSDNPNVFYIFKLVENNILFVESCFNGIC